MADTRDHDGTDERPQDRDAETAKLELPSFPGFGRKRRAKSGKTDEPTRAAEVQQAPPAPAPAAEPVREPAPEPAPAVRQEPAAPTPEPAEPAVVETRSQDYDEPLMTVDPATRVDAVVEPADRADHTDPSERADEQPAPQRKAEKKPFALPAVDPRVAAAVTGAVVGLAGCVLTFLALRACDAVRGTETCGGGPGFVVLLVILALMVVLGAVVLRLWRIAEPRAASFLGVGVLFVVMLLLLQDQLLSAWMFLVVPVVTALGFLVGHWVTSAFVEQQPEKGPAHDVR